MAMKELKYWVCGCEDHHLGNHIVQGTFNGCVYCGKYRYDLAEIVVPSKLGGVFSVEIIEVSKGKAKVQVVKNGSGFHTLPPFEVEFSKIRPRWKTRWGSHRAIRGHNSPV